MERGETLEVRAWQDSPAVGQGPRIGSWEQTVEYISERSRGYAVEDGELHRVEAEHPRVVVWPLRAEIGDAGLLTSLLSLTHGATHGTAAAAWPALHSAWLCPEIPFVFDLGFVPKMQVAPSLPQAAASRSAARVVLPETREAPVQVPASLPARPVLAAVREEEVCHA